MEKKKKGLFGGLFKANDCSCGVTIVEEPETRKKQERIKERIKRKHKKKLRKENTILIIKYLMIRKRW